MAVAIGVVGDGAPGGIAPARVVEQARWRAPTMRSVSVPTSWTVPASTASGRSVMSRITSTGLPSEGASSCTPPVSVTIRWTAPSGGRRAGSPAARSGGRWAGRRAARMTGSLDVGVEVDGVDDSSVAPVAECGEGARRSARSPPPKLSRRWAVTRIIRLSRVRKPKRASSVGGSARVGLRRRSTVWSSASITVLPVTWMRAVLQPFAQQVGARAFGRGEMQVGQCGR